MWCNHRSFVFLSSALLCLVSRCHSEVVQLTDTTFEHQTQVSTGATTGSWLIMFTTTASRCASCELVKQVLQGLDEDPELPEQGTVLGTVNVDTNPNTAARFQISTLPTIVYFHKGRMYRYLYNTETTTKRQTKETLLKAFKDFVLQGYTMVSPESVPAAPSVMDELWNVIDTIMAATQENKLTGYAIFGMLGLLLGTIVLLIVNLVRGGNKKHKKA
jgi:thiol-disulfide isomerase/thioredoxin